MHTHHPFIKSSGQDISKLYDTTSLPFKTRGMTNLIITNKETSLIEDYHHENI